MSNKNIVELFSDLAKIEGLSGNEKGVADYIVSFLNTLNYNVVIDNANSENGGNTGNIIATSGDGGEYCLLAHMDTARSTKNLKIQHTEKIIKSDETTILGADDRAGIAAILFAAQTVHQAGITPNITLAFTICEETTLAGANFLKLPENINMAFAFDSSHSPGTFISGSYGAIRFCAEIIGKASHSGVAPEKGINAILAASQAVAKIPQGRIDDETTTNIGIFNGGSAINVVPEYVKIEGEVRSRNEKKAEQVIEIIYRTFEIDANQHKAKLKWSSSWDFKAYTHTENSFIYKKAVQAINAVGLESKAVISAGGSDVNPINKNGIPAINFGIGAKNPHANNEYIEIKNLENASKIAQYFFDPSTL